MEESPRPVLRTAALAAVFLLPAVARTAAAAAPLEYHLLLLKEGGLQVRASFRPPLPESCLFELQGDSTPAGGLSRNISSVRAYAGTRELDLGHPSPGAWRVPNDGAAFELTYRAASGPRLSDPKLEKDRALAFGRSFLLEPKDRDLAARPVKADAASESGSRVATSWDPASLLPDFESFRRGLLAAGSFRWDLRSVDGTEVAFALSGSRWRFQDEELLDMIGLVLQTQTRFFGFKPARRCLVTLTEGPKGALDGQSARFGMALSWDPAWDLSEPAVRAAIARGSFRSWMPNWAHPKDTVPDGALRWFSEGFTEYYVLRTLLAAGLMTPEQALASLSKTRAEYAASPLALKATLKEYQLQSREDPGLAELARRKGELLALLLDLKLRKDGRASLDRFMRESMIEFGPGSEGFDVEPLKAALEASSGKAWDAWFKDYVYGSKELPFSEVEAETGLRSEPDTCTDQGKPYPCRRWPAVSENLRVMERLR